MKWTKLLVEIDGQLYKTESSNILIIFYKYIIVCGSLKYTEAVLMEIQRRANIPPLGIAHRATRNASLFGYQIPEGTIVLTSLYSVHMDHKFWKDPLAFRPERFLNKKGNLEVDDKHFIPFGYGIYKTNNLYF